MSDESNVLDQAIARIADETVRARVAREVELLRGSRKFGLVFDRHLPESVRLPDHPIRKGVKVGLRDESTDEAWRVARFTDTSRTVALLDGDGGERPVGELVAIREFGEPIFPGLKSVERIQNGDDNAPWHTVINGENFHALQALKSTHLGKIDLVYIDPPYNTGNEVWIYNDRYVAEQDRAKSSKWLSFIERRLLLTRDLLKPDGVIIAAVGDDEHHRLRMLMDQVFKPENFIANVTWQGGVSALSKHHGGGVDYMLIYGRNADAVPKFRDPKPFAPEMLEIVRESLVTSDSTSEAQDALKQFIKSKKGDIAPGLAIFNKVDDSGHIYLEGDLANSLPRPNLRYPITNPETGRVYEPPKNGWEVGPEKMANLIETGRVVFGTRNVPARKKLLIEHMEQLPAPSFYKDRRSASQRLRRILGEDRFPNSKDPDVISRWLRMTGPKDAVTLDFFGGSGTTTEAVLRLNAEDGGTRQSILVTNNEVGSKQAKALRKDGKHPGDRKWEAKGVFEFVTRPRISTVVTGTRPDGSTYSEGLAANVEFFDLSYLDPGMVRRGREFADIAPLLWFEAGACGPRIQDEPDEGWALTPAYGVLFSPDALTPFAEAVTEATKSGAVPNTVFIVTDSPVEYQTAADRMPVGIETVRLYSAYLTNYQINTESSSR